MSFEGSEDELGFVGGGYPAALLGGDDPKADYGAALLAGRMFDQDPITERDEEPAVTDAAMEGGDAHDHVDETPPAPTPDQEVDNLFPNVAAAATALMRGRIRMAVDLTPSVHATYEDSPDVAECKLAFNEVLETHDAAARQLFEVMGHPEPQNGRYNRELVVRESWHYEEQQLPDGEIVRQAHRVTATCYDPHREMPPDTLRNARVAIDTYVVHRPEHHYGGTYSRDQRWLTGPMQYDVVFESDKSTACLGTEQVALTSWEKMVGTITDRLVAESKAEVLGQWVESFMALPATSSTVDVSGTYFEMALNRAPALTDLLCYAPADTADGLGILNGAIIDSHRGRIGQLLDVPIDQITALDAQYPGIAERYRWVISHADDMYRAICQAEVPKVAFGLRPAVIEALEQEKLKVARLEALAAKLAGMVNINHCQPDDAGQW